MHLEFRRCLRKIARIPAATPQRQYVLEWRQRIGSRPDLGSIQRHDSEAVQKRVLLYDKSGEDTTHHLRACTKSVRNSDPDRSSLLACPHARSGEKIRSTSPAAWSHGGGDSLANNRAPRCAWPLGTQSIHRHAGRQSRAGQAVVYLSIAPKSTPFTPPTAGGNKTSSKPPPNQSRCTCATRPPT